MLRIAIPTNRPQAVTNYLHALTMTGARGEAGRDFSADQYDGLLLPGGCDVNPARYGKEPIPQEITDDDQDALQFDVLARFLEARKPVLGICRGHQLLNVAFGGTLIQHLPGAEKHMSLPSGEDNDFRVNSSHHQGIELPGKGLHAVLHSEDGVIEAIEHDSLPVWGVQWHPERMCFLHQRDDTEDGSLIFRFFLEQCRTR